MPEARFEGVSAEKLEALARAQTALFYAEQDLESMKFASNALRPAVSFFFGGCRTEEEADEIQASVYAKQAEAVQVAQTIRDRCLNEAGIALEAWLAVWEEILAAILAERRS